MYLPHDVQSFVLCDLPVELTGKSIEHRIM